MDLKKKVVFLIFFSGVIVLIYQLALAKKDYRNIYQNLPEFLLQKVEAKSGRNVDSHVIHFEDESHHNHDDTSVADELTKKVKVFCWVMTSPENHKKRAVHVLATWGKRCNKIIFATEADTDSTGLPILVVNTTSGRDHLTAKTMQTFDYLYSKELESYDWFLKADDDTYVILENMRYFLSSQNPDKPVYFGHHFVPYVNQGYFSGGAGYILSREALRRFGRRGAEDCRRDEGAEDVEMGYCMQRLGVNAGDSRDALGRSRFHCFNPETHIHGGFPDWYKSYDKYGAKEGLESISDYAITFHYVETQQMYNLEFFIYHLRPYGIISGRQDLNVAPRSTFSSPSTSTRLGPPLLAQLSTPTTITLRAASGVSQSRKKIKRRRKRTTTRTNYVLEDDEEE